MIGDSKLLFTTRGRLLVLLKKRGPCTVAYLSSQLLVTRNAIRQHLSSMERDNLVSQRLVKGGPTKPSLSYSLTQQAETLFPKQYALVLSQLVQELGRRQGEQQVEVLLDKLGHSSASLHLNKMASLKATNNQNGEFSAAVQEVIGILERGGGIMEWEETGRGGMLRNYNCPYAGIISYQAPLCLVQRGMLQRLLEPAWVEVACDPKESRCQFRVSFPG